MGPAEDREFSGWAAQYREARKTGRVAEALEVARKIVRSHCSYEQWRFQMVDLLLELKRTEDALALLEAAYDRGSNSIEDRLAELKTPIDIAVFKKSRFSAKLEAVREAAFQRKAEARLELASMAGPSKRYVAKPACPFECCRFGQWVATEGVVLYDRPGGSTEVGRVAKGEKVVAVTGEVHLEPIPVLVRFASPFGFSAQVGSIVFLLDRKGEGTGNIWVNGKIVNGEQMWIRNICRLASRECWGEYVVPEDAKKVEQESEWWVSIRMRSGEVGWTKEARKFNGFAGCS
jgi:hypothetical protein